MKLLDLFCGAGGAAMGYHRAGFEVAGVDNRPQKNFPFKFILGDALEYCREHGHEYDVVHASPPCPGYSRLRHLPFLRERCERHPKLIEPLREILKETGKFYVIENVVGAPIYGMTLCGRMFGLPVFRHRVFESSVFFLSPYHVPHDCVIGPGKLLNDRKRWSLNAGSSKGAWGNSPIVTVAGNQFRKSDGERAMGINWMTKAELTQAIPPAYTEFIGRQILEQR